MTSKRERVIASANSSKTLKEIATEAGCSVAYVSEIINEFRSGVRVAAAWRREKHIHLPMLDKNEAYVCDTSTTLTRVINAQACERHLELLRYYHPLKTPVVNKPNYEAIGSLKPKVSA